MNSFYKKIEIHNLCAIQEKICTMISSESPTRLYFPDDQEKFLKITELTDNLLQLGYNLEHTLFGIHILNQTTKLGGIIHIDYGSQNYSLNIPIKNCANTQVNFYTTTGQPIIAPSREVNNLQYRPHYFYKPNECTLAETIDTNQSFLINIKKPHNVVNPNSTTRYMLLVRNFDNENIERIFNTL
jgi:hypothetical protein